MNEQWDNAEEYGALDCLSNADAVPTSVRQAASAALYPFCQSGNNRKPKKIKLKEGGQWMI